MPSTNELEGETININTGTGAVTLEAGSNNIFSTDAVHFSGSRVLLDLGDYTSLFISNSSDPDTAQAFNVNGSNALSSFGSSVEFSTGTISGISSAYSNPTTPVVGWGGGGGTAKVRSFRLYDAGAPVEPEVIEIKAQLIIPQDGQGIVSWNCNYNSTPSLQSQLFLSLNSLIDLTGSLTDTASSADQTVTDPGEVEVISTRTTSGGDGAIYYYHNGQLVNTDSFSTLTSPVITYVYENILNGDFVETVIDEDLA